MLQPNFFNTIFVFPILNLLIALYKLFNLIKLPGDFGWAIVSLTVIVRLALHPFFKQQLDMAKKLQDIKPTLDKFNEKYKKDPKKLQQEQMRIYQEAGINPASGCLFMIIQLPVFYALYQTFYILLLNGITGKIINSINKVLYAPFLRIQSLDTWFFGFNLALAPSKAKLWYYYLVPVITAVLQYLQTNATTPVMPVEKKVDEKTGKKEETSEDFQKTMNMQMKFILPIMIGWFSYTLPVGLSIYWNIFSIFSIWQYQQLKIKAPSGGKK